MFTHRSRWQKQTKASPVQPAPSPDQAAGTPAPASADSGFRFADISVYPPAPVQRKENRTGLPDNLKAGAESLSGLSMDDVRVHYNSSTPAQVQALAYTQGTDIHVGPGQERHLAHEAWHVVQQKQGRVPPLAQAKGVAINDDSGLEREADVMGTKALHAAGMDQSRTSPVPRASRSSDTGRGAFLQRKLSGLPQARTQTGELVSATPGAVLQAKLNPISSPATLQQLQSFCTDIETEILRQQNAGLNPNKPEGKRVAQALTALTKAKSQLDVDLSLSVDRLNRIAESLNKNIDDGFVKEDTANALPNANAALGPSTTGGQQEKADREMINKVAGNKTLTSALDQLASQRTKNLELTIEGFTVAKKGDQMMVVLYRKMSEAEAEAVEEAKGISRIKFTDPYKWHSETSEHSKVFGGSSGDRIYKIYLDADKYLSMRQAVQSEYGNTGAGQNRFHQENLSHQSPLINIGIHQSGDAAFKEAFLRIEQYNS